MTALKAVRHSLKDGFTTAIYLADGNQKLIAEVRGDSYAQRMVAAQEALEAIEARLRGEFDNPALMKFGPLGKTEDDCLAIIASVKGK